MSKSRRSSSLPKKPSLYKHWFDCTNAKASVGMGLGFLNAIHYMAPHNQAGGQTVCPWAARCAKPCLTASGKGGVPGVREGRIKRTLAFLADPVAYAARPLQTIAGRGPRGSSAQPPAGARATEVPSTPARSGS